VSAPGLTAAEPGRPRPDGQVLRLLPAEGPHDLRAHLHRHGALPLREAGRLIEAVEQSGLTGRGGAAFPAGRKLRAVAEAAARASGRAGTVLVANGSESEPASSKDSVLLANAPHLVLDGIALAGAAVGAATSYLCVAEYRPELARAIAERAQAGLDAVPAQVSVTAPGYVSGQETALISALNGGLPLPTLVPPLPAQRGAHRRPTLVLNVETLAHIALIARYGPAWFRQAGTAQAPGTALVTIGGAVRAPGVYEIPLGVRLGELLAHAGLAGQPEAVLTGGYFGSWLPLPAALHAPVSAPGLREAGGALGPGVLAVLPGQCCGLAETARVLGYLARQAAGQCGPCSNGTPALAEAMNWIAFGRPRDDMIGWARQLTWLITGRGACHLPDGAAVLAASALEVFGEDVRAHARGGPCARASASPMLPIPTEPGSQGR
jgi:NADH:ubiquinone oxidoreductase subunit F (NADH-binding)